MARIVFINRVFPPAPGATGQLVWELAADLARRGHQVTVLAAGLEAGTSENSPPGVRIVRYAGALRQSTTVWGKALGYAWQYPSLARRLQRLPPADVWVSMTDPPMQAVLAASMSPKGTRLVHWAQDLYPEVAEELGVLHRDGPAARVLRRLVSAALRKHDAVVAVGRCMAGRLRQRDPSCPHPAVIPNWAPLPDPQPEDDARRLAFRRLIAPDGVPVVMYSGNFGRAHPFEAIAGAVRRTADAGAALQWAFIGDGPKLPWLRSAIGGLSNATFLPPQPWADLRVTLAAADLHLATMERNLSGIVVPSKVYGALAVARPCLLIGPADSEAARLISDSGAGAVLENADESALAAAVLRLVHDPPVRTAAHHAAAASSREVSREQCLERWAAVLGTPSPA